MQTSGTCAPLSDGVKKTIVGTQPPRRVATVVPVKAKPVPATHRAGGHAKHTKRAK